MILAAKLVPLALLVAIGFVLGRFINVRSQEIGKLALYVLSPAVVFKGFAGAHLTGPLLALPFAVFAAASLVAMVALTVAARLWRDGRERIAGFTAATGNTGFFGIPACLALVGPEALPYVVLVSFGATLYENSVGYFVVARSQATVAGALGRVLRYPGLHACWLGLAVNLGHLHLPAWLPQTVDLLAGGFSAVGMMIVGLGLAQVVRLRIDLGFTAYAFLWKFLAWPAIAIVFILADRAWLHTFGAVAHKVLLIESLTPMAAVTVVHATLQNIHPDRAAVAVAASTLIALAWLPVVYGLFG
ncbi:MAG: AEC family transporter [Solirubrobacterales bacterium]